MVDFRDKLRRAFAQPVDASLREQLVRHAERLATRRPRVALPAGSELTNAHGSCYLRQLAYPLTLQHGWRPLREQPEPDLGRCLYLDTETTGLHGGAGNLVFMTGLGFVEDGHLVVEQVFVRAFAEERAMLAHVQTRLEQRTKLVTFVGKTFDRHRLAARMAVHRLPTTILSAEHLDLLYVARRAYGQRLPDTRLRTLEEHVLGFTRTDDLPGAEAPRAFLDWLRDGSGPVDRVFEHNRLDVLSLAALHDKVPRTLLSG